MLQVSVPIAHELLAQCVKQGQALVQRATLVGDRSDYESWKSARKQWIEPTSQALEHMYGASTQAREFGEQLGTPDSDERWQQQYAADLEAVKEAIDFLTVLQSELAFAREGFAAGSGAPELAASSSGESGDQPGVVSGVGAADPDERTDRVHGPEPGDSDAVRPSVHAQPSRC